MSQRRVVITGLGQVSPAGNDVPTAWQNLLAGKSGIGSITRFDASDLSCQIAGEVKDFDIGQYIPAKDTRHCCRTASRCRCRFGQLFGFKQRPRRREHRFGYRRAAVH